MREYKGYTYMNSGNIRKGTRVKQYKGAHEFAKWKLERLTGGLERCGSGR